MSPTVRELTIQYRPHASGAVLDRRTLRTPKESAAVAIPILRHQAQEVAIALLLNARLQLLCVHELSRGTLRSVDMSPRLIIRAALLVDAAAIVIAHNHPSGDPKPSQEDIAATRTIAAAAELFDIDLIDHLIVGESTYTSLKEFGVM